MRRGAAAERLTVMSNPVRILLRLLGLVLFLGSLVAIVVIVAIGPYDVAEGMGRSCRHGSKTGPSEWCTWRDVLGLLQALPFTALVGGALLLVFGRERTDREASEGTAVLDLSGSGQSRMPSLGGLGVLAVIAIVAVTFPAVFVYRASFTVHAEVKNTRHVLKEMEKADFSGESKRPARKVAAAPKGLSRGSLLRADAFRPAMAELRRAARGGDGLLNLRVAADHIDVQVLARGRALTLRKPWNGKATVVSNVRATADDQPIITFAKLDPAAPQRVARGAAHATDRQVGDVDYLVLQDVVGLRWRAFLAGGGGQVTAAPDGRAVQ